MKKTSFIIGILLVLFAACNKEESSSLFGVPTTDDGEIVLSLAGENIDFNVETRATAISAVPSSLYIERTTGTFKSETAKNASSSMSVSGGKINTGWYQTSPATAYNYYAANSAITFGAGGSTISAVNTTDILAGCTTAATASTAPEVTLEHVFARTGTLTASAPSGYTLTDISWSIASKSGSTGGTKGTYNIATKAWSDVTALASSVFTSASDLYLTPGVYTITLSYTLKIGDNVQSYNKSGDVTLQAGKINSLKIGTDGTLPYNPASGITVTVSLTPWGDVTQSVTLS